jgi:hypothetical protein
LIANFVAVGPGNLDWPGRHIAPQHVIAICGEVLASVSIIDSSAGAMIGASTNPLLSLNSNLLFSILLTAERLDCLRRVRQSRCEICDKRTDESGREAEVS